jgi:hypothetical protein
MINQLQIYVYGPQEEGFIDLPVGTVLELEEMANAFDDNFHIGVFSLPITIPWTPYNRRLLGFVETIQNNNEKAFYFKCHVYNDGFPEMLNAKMTLLEKAGNFKYTKGSFNFSIAGTKGLFGSLIQNKKLKDLVLSGPITYTTESRVFATAVMKGSFPQYPFLKFAPVAIENFFNTNRPDYDADKDFLFKDTVNNILLTGSTVNDWSFGRPTTVSDSDPTLTNTLTTPGDNHALYRHSDVRTVPFFSLKYVFKKVFEENGYTVSGAFIDDAAWDDLVLFNNNALENYANAYFDGNRVIIPGNHVPPDMYVFGFLQGIFSLFKIYPVFDETNNVKLYYKVNDFVNKRIAPLTDKCTGEFDSTISDSNNYDSNNPSNNANGYKLNYNWDSYDSYQGDRIKDITINKYDGTTWIGDKQLSTTVATFAALQTLTIPLTTDTIVFVENENMYYQCANATTIPTKWDCWAENLSAYTKGTGAKSIDIPISTLCTYVKLNDLTALIEKQLYCGCRQLGSYKNDKGVQVVNPYGLRVFFIRNIQVGGVSIPTSTNFNKLSSGAKVSPYSLAWRGADGLAENFHKLWEEMQIQIEILKTEIIADTKTITEMDAANIYEINGIQFLPYKRERQIPCKVPVTQYLIPI